MYHVNFGEVHQAAPATSVATVTGPTGTGTAGGILRRPVMRSTGAVAQTASFTVRTTPAGPTVQAKLSPVAAKIYAPSGAGITAAPTAASTSAAVSSSAPFVQTMGTDLPRSDRPNEQPAPATDSTLAPTTADEVPAAEKTGLPLWAWIGIGVGGVAVLGGVAYFVMRKRGGTAASAPATAGLGSVHVEKASEIPNAEYYVLSHDTFMSGWGPAKGQNTVILPADTYEEAQRIAEYARSRSDQKNVRIVGHKPKLQRHVYYSLMSRQDAPAWYGKW